MVKWIVLAVVLSALLLLALTVRAVWVRIPTLQRAALTLQQRQTQAEELQRSAATLQERLAGLAESTQRRVILIKAKRGREPGE